MKRLAALVILAVLSLPCAASDPNRPDADPRQNVMMAPKLRGPNTPPPAPSEPLLSARLVRTILFPEQAVIRWGLDQFRSRRFDGNVVGLQVPGRPDPDADIPIRATSFSAQIRAFLRR